MVDTNVNGAGANAGEWMKLAALPIKKMILYQHGIGFIERRSVFSSSDPLTLTFEENEMNDILKSLCIFDTGEGKVTGVSFETSEDPATLMKEKAIHIPAENAVFGMFQVIQGYTVKVRLLDASIITGKVFGLDNRIGAPLPSGLPHPNPDIPTDPAQATHGGSSDLHGQKTRDYKLIIIDDDAQLHHIPIGAIATLQLDDPYAQADLEYFLDASRSLRKKASSSMT